MVWVALINLSLILFDLTYLWLRPVYFPTFRSSRGLRPGQGDRAAPVDLRRDLVPR